MSKFNLNHLTAAATVAIGLVSTPALAAWGAAPSAVLADVSQQVLESRTDHGSVVLSRRGADDAAGDDRGGRGRGRGADDGAGHA